MSSLTGSAEIRAETVNGRISNDFGIEVKKGKYVGSSMNGSIGGGGPASIWRRSTVRSA